MKETLVFIFGIFLVLTPFLGIPEIWRQYIVVGIGVLAIVIGYSLRRELYLDRIDFGNGERVEDSYVETTERLFS